MAYNNYFPTSYQPISYPQMPQPQPQPMMSQSMMQNPMPSPQMQSQASTPVNTVIWVQGEAGAKSYLVAPGTTVQLWDSESNKIYLKSADISGMPSIKVLEYTIKSGNNPTTTPMLQTEPYSMTSDGNIIDGTINKSIDIDTYATKEDIIKLEEKINEINNKSINGGQKKNGQHSNREL